MEQWLRFFLAGIIETANSSIQTFKNILTLKDRVEKDILPQFKSRQKAALEALNNLWREPMITVKDLMKSSGMNYSTANRLINDLVQLQVLRELTGSTGRNRIFVFDDYVKIFFDNPEYREKQHLADPQGN